MVITVPLPVNPDALDLKGRSVEQAIEEANEKISREVSKSNPLVGSVKIAKLDSGRWCFSHLLMGTMIRVPDFLRETALVQLKNSIIIAMDLVAPKDFPFIPEIHGLWAKDSFVLEVEAECKQTGFIVEERIVERQASRA